jgi:3-oxoacyl-(acyl-carrier-protein) synthase III
MIPASILGTGAIEPDILLSTADLVARAGLEQRVEDVEKRSGIRSRRWFPKDRAAAAIAAEAVEKALSAAKLAAGDLRRLIFVTSTGGDFLIPATANAVLDALGLEDTCDGFDLNNACMGFLSGFDVACRTAASDLSPVCVVVVETLSRYLSPQNHRPYFVLADAAAAAIVGAGNGRGGVLAAAMGNAGRYRGSVTMAHPGLSGNPELIRFADASKDITAVTTDILKRSTDKVLAAAGLTLDEIDWVVPHQPNGSMLRTLLEVLRVPVEKTVPVVESIGSVGAASIAVGLDLLLRSRPVAPGHKILLVGVGAGMAYGAMVFQVGG